MRVLWLPWNWEMLVSLEGGKLNYSLGRTINNLAINIFNVWQKPELNLGCTNSKPVLSVPYHPYSSTQIHVDTFLTSKTLQMMSFNQRLFSDSV